MADEKERNLLFLDLETTGLDSEKHEIIEIACVLTDPTAELTLSAFEAKLKPLYIERAEPRALEVNGYTPEGWLDAMDPAQAALEVRRIAQDAIVVGQNVSFDIDFLSRFLKVHYFEPPWHYHKVDTATLAWPLYKKKEIKGLSLSTLCTYFKLPRPKIHRAMEDVGACRRVYRELMKRFI